GAPPPDSPEGQQLGEGSLILGSAEPDEIEFAVIDHFGEIAGIAHLLAAEAAGAEGGVIDGEKRFRRQRAANSEKPAVHRCSGVGPLPRSAPRTRLLPSPLLVHVPPFNTRDLMT